MADLDSCARAASALHPGRVDDAITVPLPKHLDERGRGSGLGLWLACSRAEWMSSLGLLSAPIGGLISFRRTCTNSSSTSPYFGGKASLESLEDGESKTLCTWW